MEFATIPAPGHAPAPGQAVVSENTAKVLQALLTYFRDHSGLPPSIRALGKDAGISSTSVVNYHLNRLQDLGIIRRRAIASRGIEVVGATWTPPAHLAHLTALAGEGVAAA